MRKPYHKDIELTRLRHELGEYADARSFVSMDGKEFLAGIDMRARRHDVWMRDNQCCVQCGEFVTFEQMELDHKTRRSAGGDDSEGNLQTMCGPFKNACHRGGKRAKHA